MSGSDNLNPNQFVGGGYDPFTNMSSGYGSNGSSSSGDQQMSEEFRTLTPSTAQAPVDPNAGGSGPNLDPFAGTPDGLGNTNSGGYGNDNSNNLGEPLTGSPSSGSSSTPSISPSTSPGFQTNKYNGPTSI